jgi:predicted aldo/keto reductase-like oxidoreductase
METRRLGKTDLELGVIALGTEHLVEVPRKTVVSVVREAVRRGVNYFDVLFAYPHYQDNFGAAFKGRREKVLISGHLGSALQDGQYRRSRDVGECEELFHDLLRRLATDYVDVLFLSNCDEPDDYEQIIGGGGLLELGARLRREGKARFIGLSGHQVPVATQAVESGRIDVLMHNVNLAGHADPGRRELYHACAAAGVGLIGMKPFAGGSLLQEGAGPSATPVQCISYALAQPGVCAVVPGVKNLQELNAALAYLDAAEQVRDFSGVVGRFRPDLEGQCVYCNHCLPCPAGIDVGKTIRLADTAGGTGAASLAAEYARLPAAASECLECGDCVERCPFKVDVLSKMARAVQLFEQDRSSCP